MPKGRLLPRSEAAVAALPVVPGGGEVRAQYLRMPDIPALVGENLLDAGVVGEEWLVESDVDVAKIAPLCWYHVKICVLAMPSQPIHDGRPRLVSEYHHIAEDYGHRRWGQRFTQRTVRGSVEQYVPNLADVAIECVETGESMRKRGLVVQETLFEADVWLISSHRAAADEQTVASLRDWAGAISVRSDGHCPSVAALCGTRTEGEVIRAGRDFVA
jgi:ATP phosphoribosyltransferase